MKRVARLALLSLLTVALCAPAVGAAVPDTAPGAKNAKSAADGGGRRLLRAASPDISRASAADDDIPGGAIPASPFSDSVDEATDEDDVFAIYIPAGQTLQVTMTGAAGTDFDLYLWAPGTTSIYSETAVPVAISDNEAYPENLTYSATTSGTYYLDVWSYLGAGTYTITYTLRETGDDDVPGVALPSSPVTGTLDESTDYDDVYAVHLNAGQTLQVAMSGDAGTDFDVYLYPAGSPTVNSDSYVAYSEEYVYPERFTYKAPVTGTYYLDAYASEGTGAYRIAYTIKTTPVVGNPIAPTTMYRGRAYNVYGALKPRHTAGTYPVRIYKWRYVNGAWKSYGYVSARVSNYYTYSKYLRSLSLPYTGKWKLRAYAPADAAHVAAWSASYDYVTVK